MGTFFTALFAKFSAILVWIGTLFVAMFAALWDLVCDAVCWPYEQVMLTVIAALNAIDVSGVTGHLGAWGSLPAEIINVLGLLGVGTAITIISAAIVIRLVLQLIPFTRLGS